MRRGRILWLITGAAVVFIGSSSTLPAAGAEALPAWAHVDTAHKTLSLMVTAAQGGVNGTLNFNGYADGHMTITVPLGWRVHIDLFNGGAGALPHSLEVVREVTPVPEQGVSPALPGAESGSLIVGIPPLQKDSLDFVAAPAGRYLLICGVPRHAIGGMWNRFVVSGSAQLPIVTLR